MVLDFSKGLSIHRAHGHKAFAVEAAKQKKDYRFIKTICLNLKCDGRPIHWRDNLKI